MPKVSMPKINSEMYQKKIKTSMGILYICVNNRHLLYTGWKKLPSVKVISNKLSLPNDIRSILKTTENQIYKYFKGESKSFNLPLLEEGTSFQKKVWQTLRSIPYGETVSYSELAKKIGSPKAVRAVGSANALNPFCVITPCHRVIAKNGNISGYVGGSDLKKKLLVFERDNYAF